MKRILICILLFLSVKSFAVFAQETNVIHVMVALCDNKYQGIVPVAASIGNGQDPDNNLYWGAMYGIRTYFNKSSEWKEVERKKINDEILERIVFKHTSKDYYLVADAYNGKNIKDCTIDFLNACSGNKKETIKVNNISLGIAGNARLLAYIGHDGLMDFTLPDVYQSNDDKQRDAIVLACYSKQHFTPYFQSAKVNPVLWATHLMAPEAYTLHDALSTYIKGEDNNAVRESAAAAYNKYQKCGINGARRLLVTGY